MAFKTQSQLDKYVKERKFPKKSIYYGKTISQANILKENPELVNSIEKAKQEFENLKNLPFEAHKIQRKQYYDNAKAINLKLIEKGDYNLLPEQIDINDNEFNDAITQHIKSIKSMSKNKNIIDLHKKDNDEFMKSEHLSDLGHNSKIVLNNIISLNQIKENYPDEKNQLNKAQNDLNQNILNLIYTKKENMLIDKKKKEFIEKNSKFFKSKEDLEIFKNNTSQNDIMLDNGYTPKDYFKRANEIINECKGDIDLFLDKYENVKFNSLDYCVAFDIEDCIDGENPKFMKLLNKYND